MTMNGLGSTRISRRSLCLIALAIATGASVARSQQIYAATHGATGGSEAVIAVPLAPLVLILDPTGEGALSVKGSAVLNVQAGKVHVNSDSFCGVSASGSPTVFAGLTSVVGGACYPVGAIVGPVQENADVIPDPLAGVLPTVADWNAFKASMALPAGPTGAITASGTYNPGYYPGGLDAGSSAVISLNPGSYMFGTQVKLAGNAFVTGSGVTLFLDKDVQLNIRGSGAGMNLTSPGPGDPFYGITLFAHRETTGTSVCKFGGVVLIGGVVYVPSGELVIAGGKEIGAVIAWQVSVSSKTGLTVTGQGVPPLAEEPPP